MSAALSEAAARAIADPVYDAFICWRAAHCMALKNGDPFNIEIHSPLLARQADDAESAVIKARASTVHGAIGQLWVSLFYENETRGQDRQRLLHAIFHADIDAAEALLPQLDAKGTLVINAIRALTEAALNAAPQRSVQEARMEAALDILSPLVRQASTLMDMRIGADGSQAHLDALMVAAGKEMLEAVAVIDQFETEWVN